MCAIPEQRHHQAACVVSLRSLSVPSFDLSSFFGRRLRPPMSTRPGYQPEPPCPGSQTSIEPCITYTTSLEFS